MKLLSKLLILIGVLVLIPYLFYLIHGLNHSLDFTPFESGSVFLRPGHWLPVIAAALVASGWFANRFLAKQDPWTDPDKNSLNKSVDEH